MYNKNKLFFNFLILLMSAISLGACKSDPLKEKALAELNQTLETQHEFVKVHAAEYLIWLGYPQ